MFYVGKINNLEDYSRAPRISGRLQALTGPPMFVFDFDYYSTEFLQLISLFQAQLFATIEKKISSPLPYSCSIHSHLQSLFGSRLNFRLGQSCTRTHRIWRSAFLYQVGVLIFPVVSHTWPNNKRLGRPWKLIRVLWNFTTH